MATQISVANDFSRFPAGRTPRDGDNNGEKFRKMLRSVVDRGDHLVVHLDGTVGYGASFLEDVFGGLVRETGMTYDEFREQVKVVSDDPGFQFYCNMSYQFAKRAADSGELT